MQSVCVSGLLRCGFFCAGTAGHTSVSFRNVLGDDDQCFNGQAGTEGSRDLCRRCDPADSFLSSGFWMAAAVGPKRRKQPEKISVSDSNGTLFPSVWSCDRGVSQSDSAAADFEENVRKNVEIGAVLGYTVSMLIVLRIKEWMRRYDIL